MSPHTVLSVWVRPTSFDTLLCRPDPPLLSVHFCLIRLEFLLVGIQSEKYLHEFWLELSHIYLIKFSICLSSISIVSLSPLGILLPVTIS